MRELLQQALEALKTRRNGGYVDIDGDWCARQLFDEAAMQSAQEAIEAALNATSLDEADVQTQLKASQTTALSRSKWVKVSDGLPVVPEGEDYAEVWVVVRGEVREDAFGQQISEDGMSLECGSGFCSDGVTHWKYKYTPAPPEEA